MGTIHRSELLVDIEGEIADGGFVLTVVTASVVVVTLVVASVTIGSAACIIAGNTKTIQKQATMPKAIVLFIFLFIIRH